MVFNRRVAISGTLQSHPGPDGGFRVNLVADEYPFEGSSVIASRTTSRQGRVRFVIRPRFNTRYSVALADSPQVHSRTRAVYAYPRTRFKAGGDTETAFFDFNFWAPREYRTATGTRYSTLIGGKPFKKAYVYAARRPTGRGFLVARPVFADVANPDPRNANRIVGGAHTSRPLRHLPRAKLWFLICTRQPLVAGMGRGYGAPCGRRHVSFR